MKQWVILPLAVLCLLELPYGRSSFVPSRTTDPPRRIATSLGIDTNSVQNFVSTVQQLPMEDVQTVLSSTFTAGIQALEELPVGERVGVLVAPLLSVAANYAWSVMQSTKEPTERMYPESKAATYELSKVVIPFEFGDAAFVRPLLKQTQLEFRKLRVAYDANKDGYNAKVFHQKVDGQGAAVILVKAGGQWFGGYNPRGWASLGGSRPSIAAFLFYKTLFGWQKLKALGNGGMACGNDLFDRGIFLGAEGLIIPLDGQRPRSVASRLGTFFEFGPNGRRTLLPVAGADLPVQELKVLVGVYKEDEDIPNSGGVLDLGLY